MTRAQRPMEDARWFRGAGGVWHLDGSGCGAKYPATGNGYLYDKPIVFGDPSVFRAPRCCRTCVAAETRAWARPDRRVVL